VAEPVVTTARSSGRSARAVTTVAVVAAPLIATTAPAWAST
jgi:hypothetical protein